MRYEPTPALDFAMRRAAAVARQNERTAIEPAHLLHGLLAEEEGKPFTYLLQAGIAEPVLRSTFPIISLENASLENLAISRSVRAIFAAAEQLALVHSDEGTIQTDQVLFALLEQENRLRENLVEMGLRMDQLEQLIATHVPIRVVEEPPDLHDDDSDQLAVARLMDASANRAREALRVLEDYVRFLRDDGFLTRELKQLRHDFSHAMDMVPVSMLLASRDTEADVGTRISTEQEWERSGPGEVMRANWARLQEALRTLEEFGKIWSEDFARQIEKLRYKSYTLEKTLFHSTEIHERLASSRLYVLVTEKACRASLTGTVRESLEGGASIIQLREKNDDDRTLLAKARDLRALTRRFDALLIINDRPDVAKLCDADGVHVGQDDLTVRDCRRILGAKALVGVSTHDLEQVRNAIREGADYLGVGPMFPSGTKTFTDFPGLAFLREALTETSLPMFALGGISVENVDQIRAAGGNRIAVSQAVIAAEDAKTAAGELLRKISK